MKSGCKRRRAMTPDSLAKGLEVNATQAEEVLCGASSCKCGLGVCFDKEKGNKVHSWPGHVDLTRKTIKRSGKLCPVYRVRLGNPALLNNLMEAHAKREIVLVQLAPCEEGEFKGIATLTVTGMHPVDTQLLRSPYSNKMLNLVAGTGSDVKAQATMASPRLMSFAQIPSSLKRRHVEAVAVEESMALVHQRGPLEVTKKAEDSSAELSNGSRPVKKLRPSTDVMQWAKQKAAAAAAEPESSTLGLGAGMGGMGLASKPRLQ